MYVHLPPELLEIDGFEHDFHFFIDLMVRKLHLNRHKGFVKGKTLQDLTERHFNEVQELRDALQSESQFDVALEAADCSNFAFLTALACLHLDKLEYTKEQLALKTDRRHMERNKCIT